MLCGRRWWSQARGCELLSHIESTLHNIQRVNVTSWHTELQPATPWLTSTAPLPFSAHLHARTHARTHTHTHKHTYTHAHVHTIHQ
jgi:hypothetical protein